MYLSVCLVDEVNLRLHDMAGLDGSWISVDLASQLVQLVPPQLLTLQFQPLRLQQGNTQLDKCPKF